MRSKVEKYVGITPDLKIKAPPSIYAGLPDVVGLVVLFGS
jgi:hypothetical protein